MLCIYLVNAWSWPNKLILLYSEGAQYLYVAYGQFVLGFLTTLLLCVLCILWNKETNILRNVYLQKNKSSLGINNGFFDHKIRIIPNQYEIWATMWKKKKTFAPFICPFFFPNPLLNAFLARISCQPFFYHTRWTQFFFNGNYLCSLRSNKVI